MKTNIEVTLDDIAKYIIGARRAGSKKKFMELMEDLENGFQNKSDKKKEKSNLKAWSNLGKVNE